jgi:hypothetical protein
MVASVRLFSRLCMQVSLVEPRIDWWRIRSGDMEVELVKGKDRGGLLTRLWRSRWRLHQDSKSTACRPTASLIRRSQGSASSDATQEAVQLT